MKKVLMFLAGIILLAGIALAFVCVQRNWVIKTAIDRGVTKLTGFPTKVTKVKYNFPSTILIEGLMIKNPAGFKHETFANLPEIFVDLDLPPLLKRERLHLREVRLNIQEIAVEKNEKGVSNVSLLSSVGGGGAKGKAKDKPAPEPSSKPAMPFMLDKLVLTLREVHYEDNSSSLLPTKYVPKTVKNLPGTVGKVVPDKLVPKTATDIVQKGASTAADAVPEKKVSIDLNIQNEVFTNIDRPEAVVNVILMKILYGKTVGNLKELGIDPNQMLDSLDVKNTLGGLKSSGKEVVSQASGLVTDSAADLLGGAASGTKNQVSGFLKKLKETATS